MTDKRLDELKALKAAGKSKTKDKLFKNLSAKEKDELLEIALKMLGII